MRQNRIVVAASIRNATAIASWLSRQDSAVSVIAAGERWNDGTWRFAIEDLLGAGAVIAQLAGTRSPEADGAAAAFNSAQHDLFAALRDCSSGCELVKRGFEADVSLAAELNIEQSVPVLSSGAFRSAV